MRAAVAVVVRVAVGRLEDVVAEGVPVGGHVVRGGALAHELQRQRAAERLAVHGEAHVLADVAGEEDALRGATDRVAPRRRAVTGNKMGGSSCKTDFERDHRLA